jgi:hypothetical protein
MFGRLGDLPGVEKKSLYRRAQNAFLNTPGAVVTAPHHLTSYCLRLDLIRGYPVRCVKWRHRLM